MSFIADYLYHIRPPTTKDAKITLQWFLMYVTIKNWGGFVSKINDKSFSGLIHTGNFSYSFSNVPFASYLFTIFYDCVFLNPIEN